MMEKTVSTNEERLSSEMCPIGTATKIVMTDSTFVNRSKLGMWPAVLIMDTDSVELSGCTIKSYGDAVEVSNSSNFRMNNCQFDTPDTATANED